MTVKYLQTKCQCENNLFFSLVCPFLTNQTLTNKQRVHMTMGLRISGGHGVACWQLVYQLYGKPYVLFVFHQQEILCKSMEILRGGTTVGERWCPPTWKWATSRLCPPSTKHVLRGWYIVYGGTDTYAGRIPLCWRYTCLLVGHVTTTAVLIHQLGEHRPISGGTSRLDGDRPTLGWTIHNTLVGWLVLLLTWAIHSLVGATLHTLKLLLGDTYLVLSCLQT